MWKLRRVVLAALLVVGVVTTAYAVVATRPDEQVPTATDQAPDEVVTAVRPSANGDGPLRLGRVLVVGRFGEPVAKPEGTAESFADAIAAGVDYVEAEVVMTRDGQLAVLGSNELDDITDVASRPEFADRQDTKTIDGDEVQGWFSEDFTLAELKTLRAVEPNADRRPDSASHDGEYAVIGFDDLITQVRDESEEVGRDIGLFVRPLRPTYFRTEGLPIEPAIGKSLRRSRLTLDPERVTVESNDKDVLERVEDIVGDNVLTAYVVEAGKPEQLTRRQLDTLSPTIDAVAVAVGAFSALTPKTACQLGTDLHELEKSFMVFPVSTEKALLGNFTTLIRLLRGLRDIGVDVVLAEAPGAVIDTFAELAEDPTLQKSLCAAP